MTDIFKLDPRLIQDCIDCGDLRFSRLLLMNQSELPWFVLVPRTQEIELCDLIETEQMLLQKESNLMCQFIRENYPIDKLNVAAIGNVVQQLHVHVIGRRKDDSCWPAPVWGNLNSPNYTDAQVEELLQKLKQQGILS